VIDIRVARPDDLAAVGALTAGAYLADGLLHDGDAYADELRDAARRAREAVLLVAVAPAADGQETVVGTIAVAPYGSRYAEIAEPGEAELRMLAVAPGARRHGVAARLMRAAWRVSLARGIRRVVLSTGDEMVAAQRLYGRLGLVRQPERDWGHVVIHLRVYAWVPPTPPGVRVEAATWPAVRTAITEDGWHAGMSGGWTRRANSALPLGDPSDLGAAVDRIEAVYRDAGLPLAVRIDSAAPAGLADELARRGYRGQAWTDVLVRDVPVRDMPAWDGVEPDEPDLGDVSLRVTDEPDDRWLRAFLGFGGRAGADPDGGAAQAQLARSVLAGAPAQYVTAAIGEEPVATLRVACAQQWAELSCLAVVPGERRRGLGRTLTRRGLALAGRRGARRAFLQVEVANAGAAALYAGLGFELADGYRYFVGPGVTALDDRSAAVRNTFNT